MKKKQLKIKKKTLSSITNLNDIKGGKPVYRHTDYCLTSNCVSDFGTDCEFKTHGCCDGV
ncbi:MAG: hypothetical protein ACI8ZM_000759 [Crocinitomix sp.]|jgi:hypothetical protein